MRVKNLGLITLLASVGLSGCQSIENILTDTGLRQGSQQDVVVNPVPRTQAPKAQVRSRVSTTSQIPSQPLNSPEPPPQPKAISPSQVQMNPGQTVVPNVAPALGE